MEDGEDLEIVSQLRDYVILSMLLRKGLVSVVDIQEQIDTVRAEVPRDHPIYDYMMAQLDRMERMTPPSPHPSPISDDPMVPTDWRAER